MSPDASRHCRDVGRHIVPFESTQRIAGVQLHEQVSEVAGGESLSVEVLVLLGDPKPSTPLPHQSRSLYG